MLAAVALLPAAPALAHGAPTQPISRTAACASGGEEPGAAACKAARKAGASGNFDNLRIANVNGKDKKIVPDGHLCSGGLDDYAGLDLARTDWPSTTVTAGKTLAVRYAGTIPHQGTFRLYLTKAGYDPSAPLTWADLTSSPVTAVTDPPLRDGAYRMSVKLPKDLSGRHVLYVVWETSSTPDTYYSCSDLVVKAAAAPAPAASPSPSEQAVKRATASAKPARSPSTTRSPSATRSSPSASASSSAAPTLDAVNVAASAPQNDERNMGHWIIGGALVVIVGALVVGFVTRSSRAR